jgi:hypothetical protein
VRVSEMEREREEEKINFLHALPSHQQNFFFINFYFISAADVVIVFFSLLCHDTTKALKNVYKFI